MQIPLKNLNIYIILGGIFLIALGYILMSTENFIDAAEFSLSLYVSPPLIIIGHGIVAWGIIAGSRRAPVVEDAAKFEKVGG
jgi:hypothetical protein